MAHEREKSHATHGYHPLRAPNRSTSVARRFYRSAGEPCISFALLDRIPSSNAPTSFLASRSIALVHVGISVSRVYRYGDSRSSVERFLLLIDPIIQCGVFFSLPHCTIETRIVEFKCVPFACLLSTNKNQSDSLVGICTTYNKYLMRIHRNHLVLPRYLDGKRTSSLSRQLETIYRMHNMRCTCGMEYHIS